METYYHKLMDNGIDDMEIVMELNEQHLQNLEIPLGHRIKILKRIKELKEYKGNDLEVIAGPPEPIQTQTEALSQGGNLLNGDYDEMESYNMFQEALDEFRNQGKENKPTETKRVRFTESGQDNIPPESTEG